MQDLLEIHLLKWNAYAMLLPMEAIVSPPTRYSTLFKNFISAEMFPSVGNFPSSAWPYSQPTPSLRYPFGHNASTPTSSSTTSTPTASSKPNSYGSSTSDQNSRFPRVPDVSSDFRSTVRYTLIPISVLSSKWMWIYVTWWSKIVQNSWFKSL